MFDGLSSRRERQWSPVSSNSLRSRGLIVKGNPYCTWMDRGRVARYLACNPTWSLSEIDIVPGGWWDQLGDATWCQQPLSSHPQGLCKLSPPPSAATLWVVGRPWIIQSRRIDLKAICTANKSCCCRYLGPVTSTWRPYPNRTHIPRSTNRPLVR